MEMNGPRHARAALRPERIQVVIE